MSEYASTVGFTNLSPSIVLDDAATDVLNSLSGNMSAIHAPQNELALLCDTCHCLLDDPHIPEHFRNPLQHFFQSRMLFRSGTEGSLPGM